jgi:dolichyl-phosphate beta-glucosyltransferase
MAKNEPRLAIVIPAYNEGERLLAFLLACKAYFEQSGQGAYEVIVVDDGSNEAWPAAAVRLQHAWSELSVVPHAHNLGKGAALRTGMLRAGGSLVLVADADGAAPIAEEKKLRCAIEQGADVAVGSRLMEGGQAAKDRSWYRYVFSRSFAFLANWTLHLSVRDPQCGFKMCRRDVALHLLQYCREGGYLFDIEMLLWAARLGYRVAEVPIVWREVPGSKVRLFQDGWRMLSGLWRLRRCPRARARGCASGIKRLARPVNQAGQPGQASQVVP